MKKVVVQAMVEFNFPDELCADDFSADVFGDSRRDVKVGLQVELADVVLKFPTHGEIGRYLLDTKAQTVEQVTTITIKKLLLRGMRGYMLPVYDAENGTMVFFTTERSEQPVDQPLVVEGKK